MTHKSLASIGKLRGRDRTARDASEARRVRGVPAKPRHCETALLFEHVRKFRGCVVRGTCCAAKFLPTRCTAAHGTRRCMLWGSGVLPKARCATTRRLARGQTERGQKVSEAGSARRHEPHADQGCFVCCPLPPPPPPLPCHWRAALTRRLPRQVRPRRDAPRHGDALHRGDPGGHRAVRRYAPPRPAHAPPPRVQGRASGASSGASSGCGRLRGPPSSSRTKGSPGGSAPRSSARGGRRT